MSEENRERTAEVSEESLAAAKNPAENKASSNGAAKQVWSKKDSAAQHGAAKSEAPGDQPTTFTKPAAKKAKPSRPGDGAKQSEMWETWLRPVAVLSVICFAISLLLAVTHAVTTPHILANANRQMEMTLQELLPLADTFEDISPSPLPDGISSVYKAANGEGYVIRAYGRGYAGEVPAMIAFDADGNIVGVRFLQNNETPGLGQNLSKSPDFAQQFEKYSASEPVVASEIDVLTGATLSTNAAISAVSVASEYYLVEILGGAVDYTMPKDAVQGLIGSAGYEPLRVRAQGTVGAYLVDDGTYLIVGQARGYAVVTAIVHMNADGAVLGLWVDTSQETEGIGRHIGEDTSFINQFMGDTDPGTVDTLAGATSTTTGISEAVANARAALPLAKEAA